MSIPYDAITAWAALATAIGAVIALWVEGRRSRYSHGIDLLMKLIDRFGGDDLLETRRSLAVICLRGGPPVYTGVATETDAHIRQILDHFELVGMLLAKGKLDADMVYSEYFGPLNMYYTLLSSYIPQCRDIYEDTSIWEDVDWLYARLGRIERMYLGKRGCIAPSGSVLMDFFTEEAHLKYAM